MYPEPTVGALIVNKENKVLLLKSNKWSNYYVIPGGHIEPGEDMEDALRREIKEETNLDIYEIQLLGLQQCVYSDNFYEKKHFIFIDFICRTDESRVILNHEHQEYIWVDLEEIKNLPIEPYTKKLINEYMEGKKSKYIRDVIYNYN
ncbi:MAG: NUDIX domain-containing protein [Spirochaetales bacterium]|nr:NUDIX domain-containing protein [Spirochaetales bacterium]